jgi:hypothetical protein
LQAISSSRRIYDSVKQNTNPVLQFPWRKMKSIPFAKMDLVSTAINSTLNEEQRSAVTKILNLNDGQPFIIFGMN